MPKSQLCQKLLVLEQRKLAQTYVCFGKAFDRVNHNIVLQTLEYYNVRGTNPLVFFAPICRQRQKAGGDID